MARTQCAWEAPETAAGWGSFWTGFRSLFVNLQVQLHFGSEPTNETAAKIAQELDGGGSYHTGPGIFPSENLPKRGTQANNIPHLGAHNRDPKVTIGSCLGSDSQIGWCHTEASATVFFHSLSQSSPADIFFPLRRH